MVCKKSLYCWKNGPCASAEIRKQIWEDNIKFRKCLRDLNQSDHYWSFQITKNLCICLEGEDIFCDKPLIKKYYTGSLHALNDVDCTSITHDCNGLKFRNCYVHCPSHDIKKTAADIRNGTFLPQSLVKKTNVATCTRQTPGLMPKGNEEKSEHCHRYKNTLSSCNLKPNIKTKFFSQSNLTLNNNDKNEKKLKKNLLYGSCQNILSLNEVRKIDSLKDENKGERLVNPKIVKIQKKEENFLKSKKESNALEKLPNKVGLKEYAPMSRTTKKMLYENKRVPFLTYGCNNENLNIGSKKTHNVLASKLEVYPNALLAEKQKKDLIMKYMQSEKEFHKKHFLEIPKKRVINHSSLWSINHDEKENNQKKKKVRTIFPVVNKQQKKINSLIPQLDSTTFKTYRKPQIYFY